MSKKESPTSLCFNCAHPKWQHWEPAADGAFQPKPGPCQAKPRRKLCGCPRYERNPALEPR